MPYMISKAETPNAQYTKILYHDEVLMMTITPNGPVIVFTDGGDTLFVPWDEIVEYAVTSPNRKVLDAPAVPVEPEREPVKKKVREVQVAK